MAKITIDAAKKAEIDQAKANAAAIAELAATDAASIRAMREYIAAQPGAPKAIKDLETKAQAERAKIK